MTEFTCPACERWFMVPPDVDPAVALSMHTCQAASASAWNEDVYDVYDSALVYDEIAVKDRLQAIQAAADEIQALEKMWLL